GYSSPGADRVYVIDVPAGNRLNATLTPAATVDLGLYFINGASNCAMTPTCVGGRDEGIEGDPETAEFRNTTGATISLLIVVDSFVSGTAGEGTFTLDTAISMIPPGPANDDCAGVIPLTFTAGTATATGDTSAATNSNMSTDTSPSCSSSAVSTGRDVVYSYTTTVASNVNINVTPTSPPMPTTYQPVVYVRSACADPLLSGQAGCVANFTSTPHDLSIGNQPAGTYFIWVDGSTMSAGPFSLTVTAAAPPMGDNCGNVGAPITTSTMLTGQSFATFGNDWTTATNDMGCTFNNGPDRVYAVTVPANMRLTLLGNSTTNNLAISVIDSTMAAACTANPVVCAASADSNSSTGSETLTFDNNTMMAKTVFVVVDRSSTSMAPDTFDLGVSFSMPPMTVPGGETCAAPAMVGNNTTILSTTTGLMNDFSFGDTGNCQGVSTGTLAPDSVFETTIPANSRLTVSTIASWDVVLNVVGAPATNCGTGMGTGIVCLAGADSSTGNETVVATNATASPVTVYILVDGYFLTSVGDFQLTTSTAAIPPPAYTETTITPDCAALVTPTVIQGAATTPVISDDSNSAVVALPFAFSWFGGAVTHFSTNTNGFSLLWNTATPTLPTGSTTYVNVAMPAAATPNSLVAAFWDDLNSRTGSEVRYVVTGTAPNRTLTIEWFDLTARDSTQHITFREKLFETTNVVEFHYCTLDVGTSMGAPAARVFGAEATVGLENATGTGASQHSFKTAMSISTMNALRFTP
ncbi:MAG: hypothetical protein JNM17_10225, partial [Archangium sp.]|nr:hypothetical protein [Archangium sp.]